ncbi:hypothetical protein ScPMuIL_011522 [Solemya velum]
MEAWQIILVGVISFLAVQTLSRNVVEFEMIKKFEEWQTIEKAMPVNNKAGGVFNVSTCDGLPVPSTWPFQIKQISVSPDPVVLPGSITLSFTIKVTKPVTSPLDTRVLMELKSGETWDVFPCIGVIGSCNFTDLCALLEPVQCPNEFIQAGVPCKCPFPKGTYTLPPFNIDIGAAALPTGEYRKDALLYGQMASKEKK